MKRQFTAFLFAAFFLVPEAIASQITVPDIGSFTGFTSSAILQTFSGTGFVGMYGAAQSGSDLFAHVFGVESSDISRTEMQIDLSSLAGASIGSASIEFQLIDGGFGPHGVRITSFDSDGTLAYAWDSPSDLGSVDFTAFYGTNFVNITSLVQDRLAAGDTWLGLHFQGTDSDDLLWTYTDLDADAAQVRLDVSTVPVPEPSILVLLGAGLGLLAVIRRGRVTRTGWR